MTRLFGTDGIRGKAGNDLTRELAANIGEKLATLLSHGGEKPKILLARDTRISGQMLALAVASGICSAGGEVLWADVIPTPAVAYLTVKYGASAGVMITASHNPAEYNGIKIFGEDGHKLQDELEEKIEAMMSLPSSSLVCGADIGTVRLCSSALSDYENYLISLSPSPLSDLHIALDCAFGTASVSAERIFSSLGAKCDMLFDSPDGINVNSGCGSTDISYLSEYVRKNGLRGGAAFDGDADRCVCVDENGSPLDGDVIMAALALDMKESGMLKGGMVGTVMSNFGLVRFCEENEIRFIQTKVGDRYVSEEMRLWDYNFGGEQSGHIIFGDVMPTGDGQLTAIMLFSLMRRSGKKLSELAAAVKKMPQLSKNIPATPEQKIAFLTDGEIKAYLSGVKQQLGKHGRLVARPSGTEPCIRLTAESDDEKLLPALLGSAAEKIAARIKSVGKEDICAE